MKFEDICLSLEVALNDACARYIPRLSEELSGQSIYAFTVLLDGSYSMGITANTVEGLEKRVNEQVDLMPVHFRVPPIYLEMNAAEWVHMNGFGEIMSPVNEILSLFSGRLDDETGFEDLDTSLQYDQLSVLADQRFAQIIIRVLQRLRQSRFFSTPSFTHDVFLGVQFSDVGLSELKVIEGVSIQLNSQHWSSKMAEFECWLNEQKVS